MRVRIILITTALILAIMGCAFGQAGYWSEPVSVDNLNTFNDEDYAYLSADGAILLWIAQGPIRMSRWNGIAWSAPEILPEPVNDSLGLENAAAITPDHRQIYWVSWRDGGYGGWDIWRCNWDESTNTFGVAECLGENVNSYADEFGMCFTPDGQRMYFVSSVYTKNGQQGYGDLDIWYCDWDSTLGDWGLPYNIGAPVNEPGPEFSPFYYKANDSTAARLYFSTWGSHHVPGWQGDCDIYYATWDGGHWIDVTNAGPPLNSPAYDASACITPDGKNLYFICNRDRVLNNDGQIWVSVFDTTDLEDNLTYKDATSFSIIAYPNPANMTWKIKIFCPEISKRMEIDIFDMLGRKVRDLGCYENRKEINLIWDGKNDSGKNATSASYILAVTDGERLLGSKKLLMIK
jgi:hypothetical protein